jgi:hypothetical protein
MVVLVILGVLAAGAVMVTKTDPTVEGARTVGSMLQAARRRAIATGPVRDDVIAGFAGGAEPSTARTKVEVTTENGKNVLRMWEVVEDPDSADFTWVEVAVAALPSGAEVYGVELVVALDVGSTTPTALGADSIATYFYPDGTADAQTWFISRRDTDNANKWRVYVMPLSGIATTDKNW